jgi:hypothetical protein
MPVSSCVASILTLRKSRIEALAIFGEEWKVQLQNRISENSQLSKNPQPLYF